MFTKTLAIVDVETTGMYGLRDRIIEIGIVRVEKGKVVRTYKTLINPQTRLSPFIERLTGISSRELETAPLFSEVTETLVTLFDGALFVAHNARFDYSFIKTEFKRAGIPFSAPTLCTVRLSRRLYPEHKSHGLEAIIERFQLPAKRHHRAYDDAYSVWQFLKHAHKTLPGDHFATVTQTLLANSFGGNPQLKAQIETLPETYGVYIFYDKNSVPLFVGKSSNVQDRLMSHFSTDYGSDKRRTMMRRVARIDAVPTAGLLGSLLTELALMRKLSPVYNRKPRKINNYYVVSKKENARGLLQLYTRTCKRLVGLDFESLYGIYTSKRALEEGTGRLEKHLKKPDSKDTKLYNAAFIVAFVQHKQFRPWLYRKPVEIRERDQEAGLFERFIIDKWSIVGHFRNEESREVNESFDPDVYRILERFLRPKK